MSTRDVSEHATRLRTAFLASQPNKSLPEGASEQDLETLAGSFPGLQVPAELLDLLRVMNGSGPHWILLGEIGPLIRADEIAAESRRRASWSDPSGLMPFCPGWAVMTADGWTHAAVVAQTRSRTRSAVIDLSYGNQAYPIVASSLTALVAASADAWERGVHERQTDFTQSDDEARSYHEDVRDRQDLLDGRGAEFRALDGLDTGDMVTHLTLGWPQGWPRPGGPAAPESHSPRRLAELLSTAGAVWNIDVTVAAIDGRGVRVRDDSADAWLDLPPGLAAGREVVVGRRLKLSVEHRHHRDGQPISLSATPLGSLHVTGVLERS